MEIKSAMKAENILSLDLDDLEDVVGGKHHSSKTVEQTSNVTQDGSVTIDLSGAGNITSFFCPSGDNNVITIGSTQSANVNQSA
jgi:hypothetical protein